MRNLTVFITILVASIVVIYLGFRVNNAGDTRLPAEMFAAYMLAGGGVYGFGKYQDDKTRRFEMDSTPPPAPITQTTINQPGAVNVAPTQ